MKKRNMCYFDEALGIKVHCYPVKKFDESVTCFCGERIVCNEYKICFGEIPVRKSTGSADEYEIF